MYWITYSPTGPWTVVLHKEFEREVLDLPSAVRVELVAQVRRLTQHGPQLGRPAVDTLKGSRHANMKELRFSRNGELWRVAFAFDRKRRAVLLVGGDKRGKNQRRFYDRLIAIADSRYDEHLSSL